MPDGRVLYVVHTSIDEGRDEAYNDWYSNEHCRDMLTVPGVVSARRYKRFWGDDPHGYIAAYEFEDQASFEAFLDSDVRKKLGAEQFEKFAPYPDPWRGGYELIFRSDG
jgi:antibiotic biosynthesis monooxygenase (ABM) superfamily enzyme